LGAGLAATPGLLAALAGNFFSAGSAALAGAVFFAVMQILGGWSAQGPWIETELQTVNVGGDGSLAPNRKPLRAMPREA
jgi:hypothetical protein